MGFALFIPMRSMRNAGDFVKMYRSLKQWEWYHDLPVRVLFLHLMLEVNWKPGRFEGVDILPGQLPTSAEKLAVGCGLSRQTVRTALIKLQSTNEITIRATKRFSVVTIVNWAEYQFVPDEATSRSTKRATSNQHPINHRSTTIEEGKKLRSKEDTPSGVSARRDAFVQKCKEVIEANPERLAKSERKAFVDYWTETSEKGRMRFEDQKYFDHGRRMDTWRRKEEANPQFQPKPSTLKPWIQ